MSWFTSKPAFHCHFNNGPFVEVLSGAGPYKIQFIAQGEVVHSDWLEAGHWVRASRQFFTEWEVEALDHKRRRVFHHAFNPVDRNIRVNLDSKSLGDTLAWLPQVDQFAKVHPGARVYVSQFWPDLFDQSAYPNLHFINPDEKVADCYATYKIGYYFDALAACHTADPRQRPLAQVAADVLGIEYVELEPLIINPVRPFEPAGDRYVTIATASTAECKHWLYPGGWQTVVDWLREHGYQVMVIQKEACELNNVIDQTGDQSIQQRILQINGSDAFIGLGSGLSWLAWACLKPVVLISGFSQPYSEFQNRCYRVINQSVCHGCWNDTSHVFDRGDWDWCPRQKNTVHKHECSKLISPEPVIANLALALDLKV